MHLSRRLAVNSGVIFLGNLVSGVFTFLVSVVLVRAIGPEKYGNYSIVFAYLSLFQVLTGIVVDAVLIREVSVHPERRNHLVSHAFILRASLSLMAIIAAWAVLRFMGYADEVRYWVYIASIGLLFNARSVFASLFQVDQRVAVYAVPEMLLGGLFNILLLLAIYRAVPITFLIILQTLQSFTVFLAFAILARSRLKIRITLQLDAATMVFLMKQVYPLFLAGLLNALLFRLDQLLIYRMLDSSSLGIYAAMAKFTENLNLIPGVFITVVFPIMCSAFVTSRDFFRNIYRRSMKYMAAVIVPAAFGATWLSKEIVLLLYGKDFLPGANAFAWLMWAEVFVFLGIMFSSMLIAAGLQKYLLPYSIIGVAINVVLNLLLIPRMGIEGAAIASLNSYGGLAFLVQLLDKRIRDYALEYFRALALPAVASAFMLLFLIVFGHRWALWMQVVSGACVYIIVLYLLRFLDADDREYLRQIFLSRNRQQSAS